ncbi:Hypothetical protein HVR_LOCUS108 [uncultured virus]|nr:Hypothetical protein HVR_LOCUS108 [uncultured virus]
MTENNWNQRFRFESSPARLRSWNNETSTTVSKEISLEHKHNHSNVCFWRQEKSVYLYLFGGRLNSQDLCGSVEPFFLKLDKEFNFTASLAVCEGSEPRNILVVQSAGTSEVIRFLGGAIVVALPVKPKKRPTECNQVVEYIENDTVVILNPYESIDLEVGDEVVAGNNTVIFNRIDDISSIPKDNEERIKFITDDPVNVPKTVLGRGQSAKVAPVIPPPRPIPITNPGV